VPATLYLVRHGRTVYNAEERVQGWADSPLTDDGLAGVRRTAEHLRDRPFAAAWSSSAGRTLATAHEILRHHPEVALTSDDDLRELNFGDWETRPEHELWATVEPAAMFGDLLRGTFPGLPGGESSEVYLGRVRAGFARITERALAVGGDVLVVSHGVTLLAYLVDLLADPETDLRPLPNASVSIVALADDGTPSLVSLGVDVAGHGVPEGPLPARPDALGTADPARTTAPGTA
jgi:2,3-bisphosphoglycerate-dependent phosphoglycerate mutase